MSRSASAQRGTRLIGRVLLPAAFVAYPALVWFGLSRWSPRVLAFVLLGVLLPATWLRLRGRAPSALGGLALLPLLSVAALSLAALLDASGFVLAVPVAINAVLLTGFASTLRAGATPMIERFARLQVSALSTAQQRWCRGWTKIWCGFFVLNGGTAAVLALAAPLSWWAFYNGLLAYVLIGVLFATEWLLRRRRFGAHAAAHGDTSATRPALSWSTPREQHDGGVLTLSYDTRIPHEHAGFDGHFPGFAVLPAAVQLRELVLPCLRAWAPDAGSPRAWSGLKFPARIQPGDALRVVLRPAPDGTRVSFQIERDGEVCTRGTLRLPAPRGERAS